MKTLIVTENIYLHCGLLHILPSHIRKGITFSKNTPGGVINASEFDVLIIDVQHFQLRLCFEFLKTRKKDSRLFFIQSGKNELDRTCFLSCFEDAIVLRKVHKISEIKKMVLEKTESRDLLMKYSDSACNRCFFPYLTNTQLLILIGIRHGYSAKMLSYALSVSQKTVFSQLDKVREKFNLRNNSDMKKFLDHRLEVNVPIKVN